MTEPTQPTPPPVSPYTPPTTEPRKNNTMLIILGVVGGLVAVLCICGVVAVSVLGMLGGRVSQVFDDISTTALSIDTTDLDATMTSIDTNFDATTTAIGDASSEDATPVADDDTEPTPADDSVTSIDLNSTFTASDGQSRISAPASWEEMTDLNDRAELQVGNPSIEQYLIVLTENKADAGIADIAEYDSRVRENFSTNLTGATLTESRDITINGMPAKQFEMRAMVGDVEAYYWVTSIEGQKNYFQVVAWTLADDAEKNRAIMERTVESLEEIVTE